ncbi:MAG: ECF transporter S component [Eubacterium sp.]|nr:ECF transporter S component [Eubacterium sp.]MDE6156331.1 ECF transporter S component [Eubacterium sp.]MDE6766746.1 ECF transporter S component [Eubacterium sp.]
MKKVFEMICVLLCLISIIVWQLLADSSSYYLISIAVLIISMLPFFFSFEHSKPDARELSLLASLIAIAVVSRAVFYLIPQVKPIGAVVIVSGVCLGAKRGYLVGAFSAFISNFIFGQGMWTPFQMVALGLVGFAAGLIFTKLKVKKISLAFVGFVLTFVLYSIIVDLSSVLMLAGDFSLHSVLAVYSAGFLFNFVFGIATAVFLYFFGEQFIRKVERIQIKYGIGVAYE